MASSLLRPPSIWKRLLRGYRKIREAADWQQFAGPDWPDRIMDEEVTDRFHAKQGRSIGRWTLTSAKGTQLVAYLKRHYVLPRWSGWLAALLPFRAWSPGLQEWKNLMTATRLGLPVPRPLAAGELVGPRGKLQGFLAVEELTGMLALHEAIPLAQVRLSEMNFRKWKRSLGAELARLSRLLHDRSYFHKDLYLCHFYIHENDIRNEPTNWRGRVIVIDLHRLGRHRLTRVWWQIKDLAQLAYSSEIPGVTAQDRLEFWKAYGGGKQRSLLARLVRWKWRLYRQHNLKKDSV